MSQMEEIMRCDDEAEESAQAVEGRGSARRRESHGGHRKMYSCELLAGVA